MTPPTSMTTGTTTPAGARRIDNPVQDDVVTFLETSEESGGERTLAELDVAPTASRQPTARRPPPHALPTDHRTTPRGSR